MARRSRRSASSASFLCNDGRVLLLDFGLALMKTAQCEATKTGVTIGTPELMSPEQASGRPC
jgi:serine/threonine protein kinase